VDKEKLERFANWLNDRNVEWWPFLFMRPAKHERMSEPRVLGLAALYGFPAGLFVSVLFAVSHARVHVLAAPLLGTLLFYVVFRCTFAQAWNRRATRIARKKRQLLGR
jgi:hypothetical protein